MTRDPFAGALVPLALLAAVLTVSPARAQDQGARLRDLERKVAEQQRKLDALLEARAEEQAGGGAGGPTWLQRFTLGGYGESQANFNQGSDQDFLDNARFVLLLGYEFADWIHFYSEVELEHSFVSSETNGELSLEQFHVDLELIPELNLRIGRYLVPVGIINERHEPTTFNGVKRPSLDRFIIPTTWSQDGIGLFGEVGEHLRYQLYLGSGLDGSKFDAIHGIRKGRLDERPGINEPGLTGRMDLSLLTAVDGQDLRVGASFFASGLDNADRGTSGAPGDMQLFSVDFEYGFSRFDLRGVWAVTFIEDADRLNAAFGNGVAGRIQGGYLEAAAHVLPDSLKEGKLADADAVLFVRFENFNTQDQLPAGTTADRAGDRREITIGTSLFLTSQFVLKADFQFRDDVADLLNFGFGFRF